MLRRALFRSMLIILSTVYVLTIAPMRFAIKNQNGKYMTRCIGCGRGQSMDLVGLSPKIGKEARWRIQTFANRIAFQADNGKYLTKCVAGKNCIPDIVYISGNQIGPENLFYFKPVYGKPGYLIFSEEPIYMQNQLTILTVCFNCLTRIGLQPGQFIQYSTTSLDFGDNNFILQQLFPIGKIILRASNGKSIANCNNLCGPGSYPDSATLLREDPSSSFQKWIVEQVEQKIALKNMNGKYLSRCKFCWAKQSVYLHSQTYAEGPWALWTPEKLPNGKWALKADTGKYLTYCSQCSPTPIASTQRIVDVYVYATANSSNDERAQWTIIV